MLWRISAVVAMIWIGVAAPVVADCTAEIRALFDGGAWDPFVRENRRETMVAHHPDGTQSPLSDVMWDGPVKSINCTPHGCFMAIGSASWSGPSFAGPWAGPTDMGIADPEGFARATRDRLAASVAEADCAGAVELDGQAARLYHFFSKTEPNEHGAWWGGRYSVWVDTDARRVLRYEIAEGIASWAPTPSKDVQVVTVVYDDSISVTAPE